MDYGSGFACQDDVDPLQLLPGTLDTTQNHAFTICEPFDTLFPKDVGMGDNSESNYVPWNHNDQSLKPSLVLAAVEDYNYKGQTESRLSTLPGPILSTAYLEGNDYSPMVDIQLKNEENNGAQWEHVEDLTLEPDEDEILRRRSLDSLRAGPAPSADREAIKNNRSKSATHAELLKPRRRRGRKPSNLSPEEKRRRRLERGRLAANKCRRKKRELENSLEARAKTLLAERNSMLQINSELRMEIQHLLEEVMTHSTAACGGIAEAAGLLSYTAGYKMPPQSQEMKDLEQTIAGFCPTQPPQLQSPGLSKTINSYPLQALNLDSSSPADMMDIILGGQI